MTAQEEEKPTPNGLCNLLVQGLKSKDTKLVYTILEHQDDDLIKNVMEILPANYVQQFLLELRNCLKGPQILNNLKWLQALLVVKFSVLSSMPNLTAITGPIMEHLDDKCSLDYYQKLLMLKGKMDLMDRIRSDRRKQQRVDPDERAVINLRARVEKDSDDEAIIDLDSEDDEEDEDEDEEADIELDDDDDDNDDDDDDDVDDNDDINDINHQDDDNDNINDINHQDDEEESGGDGDRIGDDEQDMDSEDEQDMDSEDKQDMDGEDEQDMDGEDDVVRDEDIKKAEQTSSQMTNNSKENDDEEENTSDVPKRATRRSTRILNKKLTS